MTEPAPNPEANYTDAIERLAINTSRVADIVANLRAIGRDDLAAEIADLHGPLLDAGVADVRNAIVAMGVGEPAPGPS